MMRVLLALLLLSSSLAGCAEMIPDPPVEENKPVWVTEYHNFTYENNTTLPTISFGDNTTLFEVFSASVVMYNETINQTVEMKPYFLIENTRFKQQHAPAMGEVSLVLIDLEGYQYNCTVVYRLWEL